MTKETRVKISKHFLEEYKRFHKNFTIDEDDLKLYIRKNLKPYLLVFIMKNYRMEWDTEVPRVSGAIDNFLNYIITTIYEELNIKL